MGRTVTVKRKLIVITLGIIISLGLFCVDGYFAQAKTKLEGRVEISSDVPAYDGSPYVEVNENVPSFTDREKQKTKAFESYSRLDSMGRCGTAYANVCKDIMPTEKRGEIGAIRPSGWHTVKYSDRIDGNYLYNRCHLIGYQLAGENANKKNLITGTRYMNVEGMLPFENKVDDYVDATDNHVLYRVTPIFDGDNLVASGVQMEAWSVEDEGKGICFNVYCYNVQPGVIIDYEDGSSKAEPGFKKETDKSVKKSDISGKVEQVKSTFILNTRSKKVHKPDCSSVKQMSEKNKKETNESEEELKAQGYTACGNCRPF